MYSAVPPPGYVEEPASYSAVLVANGDKNEEETSKPDHVQDHQWKVDYVHPTHATSNVNTDVINSSCLRTPVFTY